MGILDIFKIKDVCKDRRRITGADREFIKAQWAEVEQLVDLDKPSARNQALIRADKILDLALKRITSGNTLGERLKNAQDSFSDWEIYDGLWKAHKIRNKMVHEAGFEPPHYMVKDALEKIRRALEDLGVAIE
ncbi:MAG: hypothetical protein U9M98_03310 [Patescibacteria group bacterium]|nr:hypothetical protein [Patescibacteria group bacterium]